MSDDPVKRSRFGFVPSAAGSGHGVGHCPVRWRGVYRGRESYTDRVVCYRSIKPSPVATSNVHAFGSGSLNLPSPISSGIQRYRESHCVRGFQISPMKITAVVFVPTTLTIIVDCDP